jgi:hypothetical protein
VGEDLSHVGGQILRRPLYRTGLIRIYSDHGIAVEGDGTVIGLRRQKRTRQSSSGSNCV